MFSLQAEREKQQEKAEWEGPFYQISCDCFFHSLNIQTGMLKLNPFIYIFVWSLPFRPLLYRFSSPNFHNRLRVSNSTMHGGCIGGLFSYFSTEGALKALIFKCIQRHIFTAVAIFNVPEWSNFSPFYFIFSPLYFSFSPFYCNLSQFTSILVHFTTILVHFTSILVHFWWHKNKISAESKEILRKISLNSSF